MNFVNKINSSINSSFELKYSYPTICNGIKKETNRQNNDLSLSVPLRDEILNLRKDFLEIVDYLNYNPAVIKILNGF